MAETPPGPGAIGAGSGGSGGKSDSTRLRSEERHASPLSGQESRPGFISIWQSPVSTAYHVFHWHSSTCLLCKITINLFQVPREQASSSSSSEAPATQWHAASHLKGTQAACQGTCFICVGSSSCRMRLSRPGPAFWPSNKPDVTGGPVCTPRARRRGVRRRILAQPPGPGMEARRVPVSAPIAPRETQGPAEASAGR